jgi:hypothetical protein
MNKAFVQTTITTNQFLKIKTGYIPNYVSEKTAKKKIQTL